MPVSFEPIFDEHSKILILGSFPSVKSREISFYYGHPQNRFWTVLENILGYENGNLKQASVEDKLEFLKENKIALWDSVYSCDIKGSSDASIKNVVPNDISGLLGKTDIKAIYCNGSTSKKYYDKYVFPKTGIEAVLLPSTSPANASWKTETLTAFWSRIAITLGRNDFSTRFYSLNSFSKDRYNRKLYKLSLDGGFSCPNRDGTIDTRGCIFCDAEGSGHFAGVNSKGINPKAGNLAGKSTNLYEIAYQLEFQKQLIFSKTANADIGYIAYFQAFTGTYADIDYLRQKYMEAVSDPEVEILSVATRPDCLGEEVISLLMEINKIKPVWIELGLQTIHEKTAELIRRGYPLSVYDKAVKDLLGAGISHIITHVILGLPGESIEMMLQTVKYVCKTGSQGIKLQLLHVLKNTDLCQMYLNKEFETLKMEEYIDILDRCMNVIPPDMVVHRLSGDGNKQTLIAPLWSADKKKVLNEINRIAKK